MIDSRSSQSLGVINERGDIATLFRAQKAMTFGILRAAGISLDQLAPEVRARVERFATTNLDAFRAFSQGLDLKDQGRFIEAREAFRRAAELDPNFALAAEQQRAMPDVNLGSNLQARAVLAAATNNAVDKGKTTVAVDTGRALAALSSGATLVAITSPLTVDPSQPNNLTANPAGSAGNLKPNIVVGYDYAFTPQPGTVIALADAAEWRGDSYRLAGNTLQSLGSNSNGFVAQRQNATDVALGSLLLADGVTTAYWGAWQTSTSGAASVSANGVPYPVLGSFNYVQADATRTMPGTGTATFTAVAGAGSLGFNAGTLQVNFVQRTIALQNLAFDIGTLGGTLSFSGLTGSASYDNTTTGKGSAAGTFKGNYDTGSCLGCVRFDAKSSTFGGSFVGRNADGLVFSTLLSTGAAPVGGVQLFVKP